MINFLLLEELRSINTIPLINWKPHSVFINESEEYELFYYPFTCEESVKHEFHCSFQGSADMMLLEWDNRHELLILSKFTTQSQFQATLKTECVYFIIVKGPCSLEGDITARQLNETELFENEILHPAYRELLGWAECENEQVFETFDEHLSLEKWARENPIPEKWFEYTFEEQQKCKPIKYIAYKRTNYLKTHLNQILCYNKFKHHCYRAYQIGKAYLIEYLETFHTGWRTDPFLPVHIRRFYQKAKLYRLYPFIYHICADLTGSKLVLTESEYNEIIFLFKSLEYKWLQDPISQRHNFPYFPLIIQLIVEKLNIQWKFRLITLKNISKSLYLEDWIQFHLND